MMIPWYICAQKDATSYNKYPANSIKLFIASVIVAQKDAARNEYPANTALKHDIFYCKCHRLRPQV